MASFPDFSGIAQPEFSQLCGAYVLAAALNQLRIYRPNTAINPVGLSKIDTNNPSNGYTANASITVQNQLNPIQFANTLYTVTGSLNLNQDSTAEYVNNPNVERTQNPVSALVYVAKKFGVPSIVVSYTESLRDTFQQFDVTNQGSAGDNLFMVEEQIVTALGYRSRLVTNSEYLYPTSANQVDIVLVNGGAHWVAITWEGAVNPDILSGHNLTTAPRNTGGVVRTNPFLEGMNRVVLTDPIEGRTPAQMQGNRKIYDPASGEIETWEYHSNFSTGCWIRLARGVQAPQGLHIVDT